MSANVTSPAITTAPESGEENYHSIWFIAYEPKVVQKVTLFSGSDGIFYRNQCKLDATNCELGSEISPSEVSKCQNPEPSKPKPARLSEIESPESPESPEAFESYMTPVDLE